MTISTRKLLESTSPAAQAAEVRPYTVKLQSLGARALRAVGRPIGPANFQTTVERETAERIAAILETLPEGQQAKALRGVSRKLAEEKLPPPELLRAAKENALLAELVAWQKGGLRLERPQGSAFHRLHEALLTGKIIHLLAAMSGSDDFTLQSDRPVGIHSFVIEHDWATPFEGATDFDQGEYRLPFDTACFEFRISGRRVCALASIRDDRRLIVPFVETNIGWVIPQYSYENVAGAWRSTHPVKPADDHFSHLRRLLLDQVRAVCILLEAQVASTEVVRAPHRLNRMREREGAPLVADYHTICLARRGRVLPSTDEQGEHEPRHRKRFHFRRGHWRHYENSKTWIKWTLVGDPDLGFIDKHYRL
jgi:hypothetical protein